MSRMRHRLPTAAGVVIYGPTPDCPKFTLQHFEGAYSLHLGFTREQFVQLWHDMAEALEHQPNEAG